MSEHVQICRLRREHERLDALLSEEARRPLPDFLRLRDLKKRKLAVKSRLVGFDPGGDRAA